MGKIQGSSAALWKGAVGEGELKSGSEVGPQMNGGVLGCSRVGSQCVQRSRVKKQHIMVRFLEHGGGEKFRL